MKTRSEIFWWSRSLILRFGLGVLFFAAFANVAAWGAACSSESLTALGVANMTIASATDVPEAAPNPEYCDVKGSVATSGDGAEPGSANFEIMLPANWNQKFIFHGVGGLAGSLASSANPADQASMLAPRVLFGLLGPLVLCLLARGTVAIKSTQSATGILYGATVFVVFGELVASYLFVEAGLSL